MYYIANLSQISKSKNHFLSPLLFEKMKESLEKKEKIILYLNKRGEYSSIICKDCQKIFSCPNCDVSLSVHRNPPHLLCHICGTKQEIPLSCPYCKSNNLQSVWIGTEQVEREIQKEFKNAYIFRFDFDSMKNIWAKKEAIKKLEDADIIIGTKMISTGFDFENIGLIGIILLEQELFIPHYRQEERVYQNIKQLIGRGERKGAKTDIVIQTFIPENTVIKTISEKNYGDFLIQALAERKMFWYPPFKEFACIEYRDKNKEKAFDFSQKLFHKLKKINEVNEEKREIIFSSFPRRKYNQYHYQIMLKGNDLRDFLQAIKTEVMRNKNCIIIFEEK